MTAHRPKPTITPEIVERFAAYHSRELAWGVCHVVLDDGNWDCTTSDLAGPGWTAEERALAAILDAFTPSQRRRLRDKVQTLERQRRAA